MKAFKGGLLGCFGVLAAIVIIVIVIAVLANAGKSNGGNGGSSSASPTPAAKVAVGTAMRNDAKQSVTVVSFKRGVSSGNPFLTPAPGNECVQVNVKLANGDDKPWMLPLSEMAVIDANGQSHSESFTCGTNSSSIDSLIPGGKATGTLYFEAPPAVALDFRWTPSLLNANSYYETSMK